MNRNIFAQSKLLLVSVLAAFAFYTWMACQIPYTHDDWSWGIQLGMRHLLTADINSRYAGNLIEVIVTRIPIVKAVLMGVVLTSIPLAISLLAVRIVNATVQRAQDLLQTGTFLFANALILLLPVDVWKQTNGWIAGFSNYVVSGLALIVYFIILLKSTEAPSPKGNQALHAAGCFVFGAAMQLFLENITVYALFLSLLFVIANRKQAGIVRRLAPLILGNLIGLIVMFSSSVYSTLLGTGSAMGEYRQLMVDSSRPLAFVPEAVLRFFGEFVPQIVSHDGILMGGIAGLLALAAFLGVKQKPLRWSFAAINLVFCLYYAYSFLKRSPFSGIRLEVMGIPIAPVVTGLDCAFTVLVTWELFALFRAEKRLLFWSLVLWLSPFVLIAPMVVVNSTGPRIFYASDICYVIFAALVLYFLASRAPRGLVLGMSACCVIALAVLGMRWVRIYAPIGECSRARDRIVRSSLLDGTNPIVLPQYPNDKYLWFPDPSHNRPIRIQYFKDFYHIPDDVSVWFESWDD